MKVTFTRWMIDTKNRKPVSIEPSRVDVIEHYHDACFFDQNSEPYRRIQIATWWGEEGHDSIPAAARIIMHNKQEYIVQGTVEEVTKELNHQTLADWLDKCSLKELDNLGITLNN